MKGFTLVELIVVVSIIATLVGIGTVYYSNHLETSRDARRKVDMEQLRSALELFRTNNPYGSYPSDLADLVPTYLNTLPVDPLSGDEYEDEYSQSPAQCDEIDGDPSICTTYSIRVTLESGDMYTVTPTSIAITPIP